MMKKNDWVSIIIIGIMIVCVVLAVDFYYQGRVKECINNPLVYAAKSYEEDYGYPFEGSGSFIVDGKAHTTLYFSSDGVTVSSLSDFQPSLLKPIINYSTNNSDYNSSN